MDTMDKILTIIATLFALVCIAVCGYKLGQQSEKELKAHVLVIYTSADQAYTKFDKPVDFFDIDNYCE